MRWVGHVAGMGRTEDRAGFDGETWGIRDHLEDLDVDGRIILKCISEK